MSARKPIVGGNWKCNGTTKKAEELVKMLNDGKWTDSAMEVVIAPVAIHIPATLKSVRKEVKLMCQNGSRTGEGAFTGEICMSQLTDFGLEWTLIGHSERRQYYGESDEIVAEKVKIAQAEDKLTLMVCIGETLAERESNKTSEVLTRQVKAFIASVKDWDRMTVAYEPVWAIGTGKVASPQQAQEAHELIRKVIAESVNKDVAEKLRILYGGSVTEKNCAELIALADVDGFLVGGASLKPAFMDIIEAVSKSVTK
eukprot:Filipodium_phascolosomae@DN63_c0_g1_i1.p1